MTDYQHTRFPLSWPDGWKRHPTGLRTRSPFSKKATASSYRTKDSLGISDGLDRLEGELRRLGAQKIIISSNLAVTQDGRPYVNQGKVLRDPGVAVYFTLKGAPRVLACDRWHSAADNMAAIAGHISAMRAQERYGVGTLDQAFAGYAALPPKQTAWWSILRISPDATPQQIDEAFRQLAFVAHPDRGGSHDAMADLTEARRAAHEDRKSGAHS